MLEAAAVLSTHSHVHAPSTIKVAVGTWNVGNCAPDEANMGAWLVENCKPGGLVGWESCLYALLVMQYGGTEALTFSTRLTLLDPQFGVAASLRFPGALWH